MPRRPMLRRPFTRALFLSCVLAAPAFVPNARAAAPGDFPLRVHIYQNSEHTHYHHDVIVNVEGMGRANIYEHGEPRGFDFNFLCGERVMTSSGFETYPARWRKKPQTLEIFVPNIGGRPGSGHTCELKVDLKDFAYFRHSGAVNSEPVGAFKKWMDKHQYDPEHGKNEPVGLAPSE